MPEAVAAVVINSQGDYLLGRKRADSQSFLAGKRTIPGETIREGESDEQALARGMKEEADIEIIVGRFLGETINSKGTKIRYYECHAKSDKITAGSDLSSVVWAPKYAVKLSCHPDAVALWPQEIRDYFS